MKNLEKLLLFFLAVISVGYAEYIPLSGPVYINPNAASSSFESETQNEPGERITQTVYGFLDFTTTIGNTVMVFSPQSAAPAPEKKTEKPAAVIETKSTQPPESEIKPSKTVKSEKKSNEASPKKSEQSQAIFSVVEVIGGDVKPSSVVEMKAGPTVLSSKIEIKESPPIKIKKNSKPFAKVEIRDEKNQIISSQVEIKSEPTILSSIVEVISNDDKPKILSSIVEVKSDSDEEPAIEVDANNIDKPEYDFLNRQPSEVVDESYRVIDLKPNSKFHLKPKTRSQGQSGKEGRKDGQSTGLVTKFGGTIVKEGVTTVHETQVIGTIISGKYAQVLESTSRILPKAQKISPSQTTRILKTAAPNFGKSRVHLEPTPAGSLHEETALPLEALFHGEKSSNLIRPSRRPGPAVGGPSNGKNDYKNKFRQRTFNRDQEISEEYDTDESENQSSGYKKARGRGSSSIKPSFRFGGNKGFGKTSTVSQVSTVSVYSEEASVSPAGRKYQSTNRRSNNGYKSKSKEYGAHDKEDSGYSARRGYKPKIQTTAVDNANTGTSLYKFKLQRPSGRWTYKTTPKPRVTIRGKTEETNEISTPLTTPQYSSESSEEQPANRREDSDDLENSSTDKTIKVEPTVTASTLKVQISTPADFSDTYYEIATIRSPYTFQVGTVKNTRFITVTSTFEKTLQSIEPTLPVLPSTLTEPLTENILASTAPVYDKENNLPIDSSIATLPPIALGTDVETPPLETITETFSTTQLLLKTHILPVIRGGNDTTSYTLVQSYHVTRLVTATKTLPPMEVYQFVPSKTLKDFNTRLEEAGSELHLELDFGDEGNHEEDEDNPPAIRAFPPDLDLANVGNDFDVSSVDDSKLSEALRQAKQLKTTPKPTTEAPTTTTTPAMSPEQIQQLALLRYLNPAAANVPQVITSSKPIIKLETVYESHLIPLFNGLSTSYSTLSRPIATVSKTEYEVVTSTVANPLPPVPINPLNPFAPPQFSITSAPIVQSTSVVATESKVLKLTFGAKTAYTTLYSTRVVPTVLTTYLTTSVPVVPTAAAFPGFFPGPFGGYPGYVG